MKRFMPADFERSTGQKAPLPTPPHPVRNGGKSDGRGTQSDGAGTHEGTHNTSEMSPKELSIAATVLLLILLGGGASTLKHFARKKGWAFAGVVAAVFAIAAAFAPAFVKWAIKK